MRACNTPPLLSKSAQWQIRVDWSHSDGISQKWSQLNETFEKTTCKESFDQSELPLNRPVDSMWTPAERQPCRKQSWMHPSRINKYPGEPIRLPPFSLWRNRIKVWLGLPCWKLTNKCWAGSDNMVMKHSSTQYAAITGFKVVRTAADWGRLGLWYALLSWSRAVFLHFAFRVWTLRTTTRLFLGDACVRLQLTP